MAIKGILFNTDMVKAIQDGRKTVTRRVIKTAHKNAYGFNVVRNQGNIVGVIDYDENEIMFDNYTQPPYQPGDILYVRETWTCWRAHRYEANADIKYKAGGEDKRIYFSNGNTDNPCRNDYDSFVNKWYSYDMKWHPSIHMPKEAARLWLAVTSVRVKRLQDMKTEDFQKEGMTVGDIPDWRNIIEQKFRKLWNSTIPKSDLDKYGWDASPWVWVTEFERTVKPECI